MGPPDTVVENPHIPVYRPTSVTHSSSDKSPMSIWGRFSSLMAPVTTCGKWQEQFREQAEKINPSTIATKARPVGPAQGSDGGMETVLALSLFPCIGHFE